MEAFWIALDSLDRVFFLCAVFGALLFVARLGLGFLGGDGDGGEGDVDLDGDGDLTLFSLTTVTAFFLVFGLAGLALHRGSQFGELVSIVGAFAAGALMVVVMAKLAQMTLRLNSSGTLDIRAAVGHSGTVYLTIRENSGGQVQIEVANRLVTVEAIAQDKQEIKTGERVEVVDVVDGGRLVVRKI